MRNAIRAAKFVGVCVFGIAELVRVLPAGAETLVENAFTELKQQRDGKAGDFISMLLGAGQAFGTANTRLVVWRRAPPLYCQPDKLALNALNYADIALAEFERNRSYYVNEPLLRQYPRDALIDALFEGLIRTFPCK